MIVGHLTPSANVTYDLGSAEFRWKDLYLSGNTIVLGNTFIREGANESVQIGGGNSTTVTADSFAGNGALLTHLDASALTSGTLDNARLPGNISVSSLTGNGALLTSLDASQLTGGVLPAARFGANVKIGEGAGLTSQDVDAVAIGRDAGKTLQGNTSVAIGHAAGETSQGRYSVAILSRAGQSNQGNLAVAIGHVAGNSNQGDQSVAIGYNAAHSNQGESATAVGFNAGTDTQGNAAVAVGYLAGHSDQTEQAVAVGREAGYSSQGQNAVAIGATAGHTFQRSNAVAIGREAGYSNQASNSIVINGTGGIVNNTTANSCVIRPVRNFAGVSRNVLLYDASTSGEFSTNSGHLSMDASNNVLVGTTSVNATGSSLQVGGVGQNTQFAFTTSGNMGGSIVLKTTDGVVYSGGAVVFGASQGNFAAIKGTLTDGGTNTRGDLIFATRNASTDATLTTRMYILGPGGTVGITGNLFFNNQVQNNVITLFGTTGLADTGQYGFGVNSGTLRYNSGSLHRWYSGTTITMTLGASGALSIAGALTQNSDRRIKKNIRDLDDVEALETLRLLKPVAYGYVDAEGRGFETTDEVIGFIAQDVAAILPHAVVAKNTSFVPSVFAPAVRVSEPGSSTMIFSLENENEIPFGPGSRVQIIWYDNADDGRRKDAVVKCISVPTPMSFECEPEPGSLDIPENIIVRGHEVDDFHTLKKDVIFTVVAAATQEIDRRLQAARSEISDLKDRAHDLETQVAAQSDLIAIMDDRFATVNNRLAALESQ